MVPSQLFTSSFLYLIISCFFSRDILCLQEDRESLLSFKSMLSDPLNIMSSWNKSTPFCLWRGVKCGNKRNSDRVIELNLGSLDLAGPISPSLGNLSFLKVLYLPHNKLNGDIPIALGRLSFLNTLDLSNNSISGRIPPTLGNISGLTTLHLGHNSLFGNIPVALGNLSSLASFNLSRNNIFGEIPSFIGNLVSLNVLDVSFNNFEGSEIPSSFGRLSKLTWLRMFYCNISGVFPESIWNISSLVNIMVAGNKLNGSLPTNIGGTVPKLRNLFLYENHFYGSLPPSLSNTSLYDIEIGTNHFSGTIPPELGALKNVKRFSVGDNLLEAREPKDWIFFNVITNSSVLLTFDISWNKLEGELPISISNISVSVRYILLSRNEIRGKIPTEFGNLINLLGLSLSHNQFSGPIPSTLGKLSNLGLLYLENNNFTGEIPSTLGNLTRLSECYLGSNFLNGTIPNTIGKLQYLQLLDLSDNQLTGHIPKELLSMSSLSLFLDLSSNYLTGPIPDEVGNLQHLISFSVEDNELSGGIPTSFGNCESLQKMYLHGNSFHGNIPSSFKTLKDILVMDLSDNNLSGNIPTFFKDLKNLHYLDLSSNNFVGEVPKAGIFANLSAFDIHGNDNLCGGIEALRLPTCNIQPNIRKHKTNLKQNIIIILSTTILVVTIAIIFSGFFFFYSKSRKPNVVKNKLELPNAHRMISYSELLNATNRFSETNLIGVGGSSLVYKGELRNVNNDSELIIAIKVFNLENRVALPSFSVECEAMRNIRHRNILKTITSCSSIDYNGKDFKAIVFEYMPNGSLDDWLHSKDDNKTLNLEQRFNVAIDVASALDYLHNHSGKQIVHRDLKPKNILLDNEMVACIGDFGLARFIVQRDEISEDAQRSVGFKGTIGYAPPEYGAGGEISVHGDVYSYGILILEMLTGKRPTDDISTESLNLREYVRNAFPNNFTSIIDPHLLAEIRDFEVSKNNSMITAKVECINAMLEIGLVCSEESARKRMRIPDVVCKLNEIRERILNQSVS